MSEACILCGAAEREFVLEVSVPSGNATQLFPRMTRRYGSRAGRLAYYLLKPFLHPLDWITTRAGGGAHQVVCTERPADAPR